MVKTESNTDLITRRAPRWAWDRIDEMLEVAAAGDACDDITIEAVNVQDVLVNVDVETILSDEPAECPNALAGILCDCAYCEDDDLETLYDVHVSAVIHLAGPPARHTRESIHENLLVRLQAGDHHDLDKAEVMEVRVDR